MWKNFLLIAVCVLLMRRHRDIRPPCGAERCCPDREGGVESAPKGAVSFCFSSEVDASAELRRRISVISGNADSAKPSADRQL